MYYYKKNVDYSELLEHCIELIIKHSINYKHTK